VEDSEGIMKSLGLCPRERLRNSDKGTFEIKKSAKFNRKRPVVLSSLLYSSVSCCRLKRLLVLDTVRYHVVGTSLTELCRLRYLDEFCCPEGVSALRILYTTTFHA
jgi:hypothetical protein